MAFVPSSTARSGASGVVSSFVACVPSGVSSTMSVNVPPISTARRAGARDVIARGPWSVGDADIAGADDPRPGVGIGAQEGGVFVERHDRRMQPGLVEARDGGGIAHRAQNALAE